MDDRLEFHWFDELNEAIVGCYLCPRLVAWREQIAREKKREFASWDYWGKPVPNFGDPNAERLILGLAPAAHGANRTGQMFTGDRSGEWLFRALHKAGIANVPNASSRGDGLKLSGALITASVHCAPPVNKPLPIEVATCNRYLKATLAARTWKSILCLGSLAYGALFKTLGEKPQQPFGHSVVCRTRSNIKVVGSYHPSQQNTFTGKLTEPMLDAAVAEWLRD